MHHHTHEHTGQRHQEGERPVHRHDDGQHAHQHGHPFHKGEGGGRPEGRGGGRPEGRGGAGRGGGARRGEARFVLLDALRDGPKHGYEIMKTLEERSSGQYAPSPGTVYPTLQLLEDLGFVSAAQDAERRVYRLTEKGQTELETRAEEVNAFWARFQKPDTSPASQAERGFLQDELRSLEQTAWSGLRAVAGPNDSDTTRRVRLAVEHCRNEVRRILTEPATKEQGETQ